MTTGEISNNINEFSTADYMKTVGNIHETDCKYFYFLLSFISFFNFFFIDAPAIHSEFLDYSRDVDSVISSINSYVK